MKYLRIYYRLLVYFTSLTVCSGDIKKKKSLENEKKKSSENGGETKLYAEYFGDKIFILF